MPRGLQRDTEQRAHRARHKERQREADDEDGPERLAGGVLDGEVKRDREQEPEERVTPHHLRHHRAEAGLEVHLPDAAHVAEVEADGEERAPEAHQRHPERDATRALERVDTEEQVERGDHEGACGDASEEEVHRHPKAPHHIGAVGGIAMPVGEAREERDDSHQRQQDGHSVDESFGVHGRLLRPGR